MSLEKLEVLIGDVDRCVENREEFKAAQEKLDGRRASLRALQDELDRDQRKLNAERRQNEWHLKNIRRDLAETRKDFARSQKVAAEEFADTAADLEDALGEADAAKPARK